MNTLSFLQRVLPSTGFYASLTISSKGQRQKFFSTVEELAVSVISYDRRGDNTYYAISAYNDRRSRKQENVRVTKVIALDVDCGSDKPFPTWKEGLAATGAFIGQLNLPKPMIVHSGNGLHVYWVLTEELEPMRWKPLAEALKKAAKARGFEIDPAVPADNARVLRPIGTANRKSGTTVRLLVDALPSTTAQLSACLAPYMAPRSDLAQALSFPLANATVVAAKCPQINWAIKHQSEVEEPFWYGLLGIAAYCQDEAATAIAWSDQHPQYNQDETIHKLQHWKQAATGPTTCKKFEELRPAGCKGCKFKNKVGTPARLGVQYLDVVLPTDIPDHTASSIPVPKPFKRTVDGIKMIVDGTDIDICKFDVYPVSYGKDETLGYETVCFHWNRLHAGWRELKLRQALLTEGHRDFATAIADQGIVLQNRNQTEYFQLMLRSYMDELRQKRAMTNLYATMGWKENFSRFIIGDTILRRNVDGSVNEDLVSLSSGATKLGHELWNTSGSLEEWIKFTSLVAKADLRAHMFALTVGFSAPLYAFTGLKGLIISLYGPTGGGKTLAQMWIQSIFGNPERLHFAAKFTQNALFGRMGLYSHMPMTIDEVTLMNNKDVGDFIYWVSQGRDKARMTQAAEERDAKIWALPVVVSTNKSINSKLIAGGMDTDAQLARILELNVPSNSLFTRDSTAGRKIYEFVTTNYGHVGREFIKHLLELGNSGIRAAIAQATEDFHREYSAHFSGEERYWEQAIILADLAGKLAKSWGLIAFDHKAGIEWVLAYIGVVRRAISEFKIDAFDTLTEYLNTHAEATLIVTQTGANKPIVDFNRLPRGELRVRFELFRKTSGEAFTRGTVVIDRTHLRRWLAQQGIDYKAFLNDLQDEGIIVPTKNNKAYLGKNSPIKLGQSYVLSINLTHSRLQGILNDADQALEDLAFGQLKIVDQ